MAASSACFCACRRSCMSFVVSMPPTRPRPCGAPLGRAAVLQRWTDARCPQRRDIPGSWEFARTHPPPQHPQGLQAVKRRGKVWRQAAGGRRQAAGQRAGRTAGGLTSAARQGRPVRGAAADQAGARGAKRQPPR